MMDNFLYHIANIVHQRYGEQMDRVCLVFPNRRAGLFFSKYLSEITTTPIWSPAFKTINELMQDLSDLLLTENLELVFELFKVFKIETGKQANSMENFDDFFYWGEMLLNDFDDIDKYLVNASDLFHNLEALKEMEDHLKYLSEKQLEAIRIFWKNLDPGKTSKHKNDFIEMWSVLNRIYSQFRANLYEKGRGYEGMIYREVAEKIKNDGQFDLESETYIIVGFNALNPCEDQLFDYLYKRGKASFFWDYDTSYTNNKNHEAGYFIRKNLTRFPPEKVDFSFSSLEEKNKKVEIIAASSDIGQAKLIPQILHQGIKNGNRNLHQTAVVLADEKLLMPVLYAIPSEFKEINVTMGYPLKDSPLYSLVINLIELQKRKKTDSGKNILFYHKPVLSILNHQYLLSQNIPELKNAASDIIHGNRIYIDSSIFDENELLRMIFKEIDSPEKMSEYILQILLFLFNKLKPEDEDEEKRPALHQEYLYHLYLTIQQLGNLVSDEEITLSFDTYLKLLDKLVKKIKIPFRGEPLAGVQVMGILETRALDFENLIMVSMNEGILPGGQAPSTFIPYNLRKGFGLPTREHQDSIYAYYFYRLIQRAKNITLVYNNNSQGVKSGEMSRFLTQLKFSRSFKIQEKNVRSDVQISTSSSIKIEKDKRTMEELLRRSGTQDKDTYLSPSALNCYLDCSLKFYFRYIAGLKEPEDMSEEIDYQFFGTIFHKAINLLYAPFVGRQVKETEIVKLTGDKEKINAAVEKSVAEEFHFSSSQTNRPNPGGRNLVVIEILKKYLVQILKVDMQYLPFEILFLEKKFSTILQPTYEGRKINVRLGGTIDRIDRSEGRVRIIDYKTGSGELSYSGLGDLFKRGEKKRNGAVFQTFLYALLVSDELADQVLIPGLYYIRDLYNEGFDYHIQCKDSGKLISVVDEFQSIKNEFEKHLTELLDEILNQEIPFSQVEDDEICGLCPYRKICHR